MGTNYYIKINECDCCGRFEELHIGKSSWGWSFNFQGYPEHGLTSWKAYKDFLKDKVFYDEYGEHQDYDKFVTFVEGVKAPGYVREDGYRNRNHNEEIRNDPRYDYALKIYNDPLQHWEDEAGYSFGVGDFS